MSAPAAASFTVEELRRRRSAGAASMFGVSALQAAAGAAAQLTLFAVAARQLDASDFGRFTAFATVAAWLTLSDAGLNKALLVALNRSSTPGALVSAACVMQWIVSGGLMLFFAWWQPMGLLIPILLVLAVAPLSAARAVYAAKQQGWLPAAWDLAGSCVMILLGLTVGRSTDLKGLVTIAASGLVTSRLMGGLALWASVAWRLDWRLAAGLWRDGRHFLAAQLADLIAGQGLPWVALAFLPSELSGGFSAAARLAAFAPLAVALFTNSLLPAYADASARGDSAWIRSTIRRSSVVALAAAVATVIALVFALPSLFQVWLGRAIPMPAGMAWAWLALWAGLQCATAPLLSALYGTGRVKGIAGWGLASALCGLALGAWASTIAGAAGLGAALAFSHLTLSSMPAVWQTRSLLEEKAARQ